MGERGVTRLRRWRIVGRARLLGNGLRQDGRCDPAPPAPPTANGHRRGRSDPLELLEYQARTRLADLRDLRYARMAESPFAFFRGAAAVMAMDLATTPVTGLQVQACGDAHVTNFGKFATPERNMIFDINDFDETLPGPWEWDVKRLCASLAVVARAPRLLGSAKCDRVVSTAARTYRECLADSARMRALDSSGTTTSTSTRSSRTSPVVSSPTSGGTWPRRARKTHLRAVAKLTHDRRQGRGSWRIRRCVVASTTPGTTWTRPR